MSGCSSCSHPYRPRLYSSLHVHGSVQASVPQASVPHNLQARFEGSRLRTVASARMAWARPCRSGWHAVPSPR
eukprot:3460882-Prymnesium_polylepis.2